MTANKFARRLVQLYLLIVLFGFYHLSFGDEINRALNRKITAYNKKLAEWSHHPILVQSVMESNAGARKAYSQKDWETFFDEDAELTPFLRNPASILLSSWETADIAKLFVRDKNGNIVAGATKPRFFNIADRMPFTNAIQGNSWADDAVRPDPLMRLKCVQISAPIRDEQGQVIGIIHSAVIVHR